MDPDSQNKQPFAFSYADGVAINRSHEEGLRIKQVATQSLVSKANRLRPPWAKKKRLVTVFLRMARDDQGEGKALKRIGGSSSTNEVGGCQSAGRTAGVGTAYIYIYIYITDLSRPIAVLWALGGHLQNSNNASFRSTPRQTLCCNRHNPSRATQYRVRTTA